MALWSCSQVKQLSKFPRTMLPIFASYGAILYSNLNVKDRSKNQEVDFAASHKRVGARRSAVPCRNLLFLSCASRGFFPMRSEG